MESLRQHVIDLAWCDYNQDMPQDLRIALCEPESALEFEAVRALLLDRRTSEAETAIRSALNHPASLLAAWQGPWIVGAALFQEQPGKVALLWPPRVATGQPQTCAAMLLDAMLDRLKDRGVQIAQAFPDVPNPVDQQLLESAGFEHVADLLYLVCTDAEFPTAPPTLDVSLEACDEANFERLIEVLERTYEGTLDCPRLNGVRTSADVLATYLRTGDAAAWFLAHTEQEDVGCLLLADHPQDEQWELVYIGLTPGARGKGLGRQLLRQAQWLTRQAGRQRLVLSVDAANAPAIGLYASAGFVAWDRRSIHLRIFERAD